MDWLPPKSPLVNGLFVRRPLSNFLLRAASFFCRAPQNTPIPPNPQKILLCNTANLGDVVTSTTVLPVLKKRYPNAEIDFLISEASAAAINGHPLVKRVHFHRQCKAALHLKKYDISIDLYPYYPNAIPLLAECRVPVRIGYPTGGFGRLLTHPVPWNFADRYVGYAHLHLLTVLGIDVTQESPLPSYFFKKDTGDYIVVHMGSLHPLKEWVVEKWIALIQRFRGERVVLTGKGEREGAMCRQVAEATGAEDRSNRLNWMEFVTTIQEARLLISVDSAAVHIAAGALTPTVELFAGINSPYMWTPPYPQHRTVMQRVPCAPCFNKRGCPAMTCIRDIDVEECYETAHKLLEESYAK